jgi:hypothetical protein
MKSGTVRQIKMYPGLVRLECVVIPHRDTLRKETTLEERLR